MHDIRAIRDNPKNFDAALKRRGIDTISNTIIEIDQERRAKITSAEAALAERNAASKLVGEAKASGNDKEFERLRTLVSEKKVEIASLEDSAKEIDAKLTNLLLTIPNTPYDDVPDGLDENDNVEIHKWGTPQQYEFDALEHYEIKSVSKGMDFETAAKMSGSRFVILSGAIARIHRALAQFMLDIHTNENNLIEVNTPVLVRDEAMIGTGQLPKFSEDSYQTTNGWWLVPTSEVTLTNIVAGTTLQDDNLPRRFTAHSLCFRSEAGSAGRDTSGMLRQHQFEKVEMVSIVKPEDSDLELERMTKCAQGILEKLNLPYRTVKLCTGDMGFSAKRTNDIEVWLPGQNAYREISSCSTCGDFQSRRMNARFKRNGAKKPEFVHTLNGSGLAVGRCLIAVLENGQQEDGSVILPEVLKQYLGGKIKLNVKGSLE
ncbi:MAG: serine--tRNA ligase [Rhodobacteraceae bacterium]|jgi:seryl-tRNA synthetase|nr:MAG: serine--tRNA ligase [Paracoccaceae bacterium]|tara:strand:+ start:74 stop:1366 length:1293 start_codon:yes stop_codon:yes gene_type:complete